MPAGRPRKYSGPLLPGQKSVKQSSKKYVKRYRAQQYARTNVSRTRAKVNNMIYNQLKKFSESKILPLTRKNESAPLPIQLGAQAYWWGGVLGENIPSSWAGGWNPLQGIASIQGDLATQRNGNYVYLNQTVMQIELDMSMGTLVSTPHEFRMIVFKARRATDPQGVVKTPNTTLFLDNLGAPTGHAASGINGTDLLSLPLNKRDWYIQTDKKFTLSPQSTRSLVEDSTGYSGYYPTFKRIPITMKHKIKARYPPLGSTLSEPVNYDYRWAVVFYARPIARDTSANDWEINLRGSTTFMDN